MRPLFQTIALSRRWYRRGCLCAALACCLLSTAGAEEPFALNGRALATLDFDGVVIPTSVDKLKETYPQAQVDRGRGNDQAGLVCYTVSDFPGVDSARFYFCDDRLYQFEAQYSLERLEQMGGAQSLLQELMSKWGPVDHAGQSRWTWQRPMYSRRADFYAWPRFAKLTITDTAWTPVVTARLNRTSPQPPGNLGF